MARMLTLRYMGNDLKLYIPDFRPISTSKNNIQTLNEAWQWMGWEPSSPNTPVVCGFANAQTQVGLTDYYVLMRASVGDTGHKCKNMYLPYQYNWDEAWPEPCGENKILIPPAHGNWTCPANGRYVQFTASGTITPGTTQSCTANVYEEDDTIITMNSGGSSRQNNFYLAAHNMVFTSVTDWDSFRHAETFNDAKQYGACISMTLSALGIWVQPGSGNDFHFLRILWDLTRAFGGDDDDPTTDPDDESDDPYSDDDSPYDPSDTGGGDGDGDDPYDPGDPIPEPDVPNISIADSGLVTIYTPTSNQLASLASYLWSNDFITSMVKDLYADALDVIISLGFVPFSVSAGGTREIKVGNRGTTIISNYPAANYHKFDAGTISLKTTLGAYIDFAPYTKGDIYIPFVGYVPLDIDAFMGHDITLKYIVDLCTGSAVAILKKDSDVWQQFACNLLTQVPLSAANYAQMYQTIIGATAVLAGAGVAGAAGIGGAAVGGEAAEGAQAIASQSGGAAKAASGIMSAAATKPQIQKSNNLSLSAGLLGNKKAFIQLYRPNLALPDNQNKFQGYPSYIETALSDCSGYTRVSSCNLTIAGATGSELSMIDSILKTGFIVGAGSKPSGSGILLCQNKAPAHQIKKEIVKIAELTGTFRDSVSVINPTIRIEYNSPVAFDYVYVSHFGRWYFVEDITMVRNNVMDISLRVDVLETFADGILANKAIIDKSASKYNLYLNDDSLKMYQKPLIQQIEFPNALFSNHEWVLIVAGS